MEELLGRVKQGFWTFTGLNFKWKHEHKQWALKESLVDIGEKVSLKFIPKVLTLK